MPMCRNGRRCGLKIRWWQHRVGSSPTIGTNKKDAISFDIASFLYAVPHFLTHFVNFALILCGIFALASQSNTDSGGGVPAKIYHGQAAHGICGAQEAHRLVNLNNRLHCESHIQLRRVDDIDLSVRAIF